MKDGLTADFTVEQAPNSINDFSSSVGVVKNQGKSWTIRTAITIRSVQTMTGCVATQWRPPPGSV
jgi:hypothetical protein